MLRYALISAALHIFIILMTMCGLLTYNTDVIDMPQPIAVEIVDDIEEVSKSPNPLPNTPEKEAPQKEISLPQPTPEPESLPDAFPEKVLEDAVSLPEVKKEVSPKEKKAIPEPAIDPPKVKPVFKKPASQKSKKKTSEKLRDFDSILKNLAADQPKQKSGKGGVQSDHLAASELDLVRKQIESVWRLPAGVKGMHAVTIKVTISMNPDRTVRSARLVNQSLLANATYGVLAETALRAVNEFRYKPLLLPPNHYKIWKEITMEFDPRELL